MACPGPGQPGGVLIGADGGQVPQERYRAAACHPAVQHPGQRDRWRRRNAYYYRDQEELLRFLVPPGSSVLEVGAGTGALLADLRPSRGLGIDLSEGMVQVAREKYPHESRPELEFRVGDAEEHIELGAFDVDLE